jgi:carbonic anhydrase/acetyltransferase-like protein (isoleucine patch superfamily)
MIRLSGDVDFRSSLGDWGTATITLNRGARLHVDGDIVIGPGTVIVVDAGATLRIGGRRAGSGSGLTARTTILVRRSVDIGHDCIVGPDTFISDCDWHSIDGSPEFEATAIGDWVWVARGASITKGARIGAGCIVAAGAVCRRNNYPERTLIAGVPASVTKLGVRWMRELATDAIRVEQP